MFTSDRRYIKALKVTFHYVFLAVPVRLMASLLIALVMNRKIRGVRIYRTIFYIPSLLGGSVAIALLWRQVFGAQGIFNQFLNFIGLSRFAQTSWITEPNSAIYTLIILLVWQFGASMVIFLAGLKQIPISLYEAGRIDGAGNIVCFFNITLPMLSPIILFNLVMEMIHAFQAFTPAFIITGGTGGVLDSVLFYTLYLYIKGFNQFQMGYASAMAWVLLVFIAVMTFIILKSSKKWVYYE
jgi:multiple sugar transport system permease protein